MCGLFGFVGTKPNPATIVELMGLAARRGPDSYGFAWNYGNGTLLDCMHQASPFNGMYPANLGVAKGIIGHCRLATSGGVGTVQPLACGAGFVAHNGNIYNAEELADKIQVKPKTPCDSEILGLLVNEGKGPLGKRLERAAGKRVPKSPLAALALWPSGLAAIADGLPIEMAERPEGVYLCSQPFAGSVPIKNVVSWPIVRSTHA